MSKAVRTLAHGVCACLLIFPSGAIDASPRKPKGTVLCLPPGSSSPRPCGITSGASMAFRPISDVQGTTVLRFIQRSGGLRGRPIDLQVPAGSLKGGQWYGFEAPQRQMCTARQSGQVLQFEIQVLTADLQQSQASGDADSVGVFQMRCR